MRVGVETNAAQEVAVRHPRRRDDHFARRKLVGREDAAHVLDARFGRFDDLRRVVGQSACSSPPRQRRAAADNTAWRAPPIPMAMWSFVPRIAAVMDADVAVLDELDARAGGADLLDEVVVTRPVEHDR